MRHTLGITVVLVVAMGFSTTAFGDTYLQGVDGDHARAFKHDRFYSEADKDFHAEAYDWSGVGMADNRRLFTMISPRYFVSAIHAHPAPSPLYCGTRDNPLPCPSAALYEGNTISVGLHQYSVSTWGIEIGADLWLGRLTEDIPEEDNIAYYPILDLASESDYIGKKIYFYGKPNRVSTNNIDWIDDPMVDEVNLGRLMACDFDEAEGSGTGESECKIMSGDSGGPSFVVCDGKLALVGVHRAATSIQTPVVSSAWIPLCHITSTS